MKKATTPGNGKMFAIAALCGSVWTWLNGKSEFFTAILNEGEDDYVEVSRLQAICANLGILAALVLIVIVGNLVRI